MIHEKNITINKIKIKMLSRRRIEPTPTGVEAGIQVELVTCIGTLRFTSRQLGRTLHYEMDNKRSGILTVNGFISATQRF